jgi:hypothetical protein
VDEDFKIEPPNWTIQGFWPEKGVGFFGGPPKAYKSWLALLMALCLVLGVSFLGREVLKTGPVMYLVGEGKLEATMQRVDALLAGMGRSRRDLGGKLYVTRMPANLEDPAVQTQIMDVVRDVKPILVVFDPLARFLSKADENSASEMRVVTNFLTQDLTGTGETSVLVVHHTDKKARTLRGTGDLLAASDVTLLLEGKAADGTVPIGQIIMKDAEEPDPFNLRLVIETDEEGALTKAQLETTEAKAGRRPSALDPAKIAQAEALMERAGAMGVGIDDFKPQLRCGAKVAERYATAAGGVKGEHRRWVLRKTGEAAQTTMTRVVGTPATDGGG